MAETDTPLFDRDGDTFVATGLARGPWDPGSCHGGAPAALLASLVDATPSLAPMRGVRLTYDLLRPVPLGPVVARTDVVREGKRVQLVDAHLTTPDGVELVRCRALRLRDGDVDVPDAATADAPPPSLRPDDVPRASGRFEDLGEGFWSAVDIRPITGEVLGSPGPGAAWFRLTVPIADEVPTTPLARAAAAADFGNGLAPPLPITTHRFVNPDLTVDLHRLPETEWVALDSRAVVQRTGAGLTTSTLSDERGRIGAALQSLFVEAR